MLTAEQAGLREVHPEPPRQNPETELGVPHRLPVTVDLQQAQELQGLEPVGMTLTSLYTGSARDMELHLP